MATFEQLKQQLSSSDWQKRRDAVRALAHMTNRRDEAISLLNSLIKDEPDDEVLTECLNALSAHDQLDPMSFLQRFQHACVGYYPSCGHDLRGIHMVPVQLLILSDNLFAYSSPDHFLNELQTFDFQKWFFRTQRIAILKVRRFTELPVLFPQPHDADHPHWQSASFPLWCALFMEDNLQTLGRIKSSGLKLCLFIGKNDGCREGGNDICVNEIPFFLRLMPTLGDEWLYITDHGPITRHKEETLPVAEQYWGPIESIVERLMRQLGIAGKEEALQQTMERLSSLDPQTFRQLLVTFRDRFGPLPGPNVLELSPYEDWQGLLTHFGWEVIELRRWVGWERLAFMEPHYSDTLTWCKIKKGGK